ncbi:MAG: MoaD/ThiS family protein [Hahellaceae bacterium]|nr:MoaD/ThiS family protein [Hahellaceae bacterium]
MPVVQMTPHLYRFFPQLEHRTLEVPAGSVAEVLRAIDALAPGFTDYLLDDHGALRRHVNIGINQSILYDRKTLSDYVPEGATLYIFQALTGG